MTRQAILGFLALTPVQRAAYDLVVATCAAVRAAEALDRALSGGVGYTEATEATRAAMDAATRWASAVLPPGINGGLLLEEARREGFGWDVAS